MAVARCCRFSRARIPVVQQLLDNPLAQPVDQTIASWDWAMGYGLNPVRYPKGLVDLGGPLLDEPPYVCPVTA